MVNKIKMLNKIQQRTSPNDIFYTPLELSKKAIDMIDYNDNDIWFDPFKGEGSYYNQFPNNNKVYTEITEGKDFFEFNDKVDIICSNPPYSLINKVLEKCSQLNPRVINLLIGMINLSPRRIQIMNDNGYYITKLHLVNVKGWFNNNIVVQFEKGVNFDKNIITFDRITYKN